MAISNNVDVTGAVVKDSQGRSGKVVARFAAGGQDQLVIGMAENRQMLLPGDVVALQDDGSYLSSIDLNADQPASVSWPQADAAHADIKIPVIREELAVSKRQVEGSGVRVSKTVDTRTETVDLPLMQEEVRVERVTVNAQVAGDTLPATRYEGDILIVPVLEEVLVVEKRMMLKEELHITRVRHETRQPQEVVLRSEQVSVADLAPPSAASH